MVSRHDLIYCENCSCVCYFNHELNRWVDKYQKPMFTQKHCSIECYHEILRELELEFTLNSEARTSITDAKNAGRFRRGVIVWFTMRILVG